MDNTQPASSSRASLSEILEEQRSAARDQLEAAWQLQVARVEEQLSSGWRQHFERVIEERFGEIAERVEEAFSQELQARLSELRSALRRELGDRFNQSLRRLRKSESETELYANLLDAAGAFCRRAALLLVDGSVLRCIGSHDFVAEAGGQLGDVEVPLASAPALHSAVEARDTTVAARVAAELSEPLTGFFGEAPDRKASLFPVVVREKTAAVLCADGGDGDLDAGSLELLTMMAASSLEARAALSSQPPPAGISGAEQTAAPEPEWLRLPPGEREAHLRARRFARVQVAEMRLYKANAVKEGRAQQNLYSALREDIDAAREAFRLNFVAGCTSMADYLHLELVRTLANDDACLLGPGYPGPLV
jgi:hypothetical protein